MPLGNGVWLGTRLPLEPRLVSAQQSSMFTNWYPASLSPAETNLSAMPRIIVSLKTEPHLVVFQLLKPIGGGGASPLFRARADGGGAPLAAAVVAHAATAARSGKDGGRLLGTPHAAS